MTAPDEPRATLREDERALAEVLAAHHGVEFDNPDKPYKSRCACGEWWYDFTAHLARVLAPVVAAARAEVGEQVAAAIEALPNDPRWTPPRVDRAAAALAARIAGTS